MMEEVVVCRYLRRTCVTTVNRRGWCIVFSCCVLMSCVQVLSGASVGGGGCEEVWGVLERRFNYSEGVGGGSSHVGRGGGGAPHENLCQSSSTESTSNHTNSCCPSTSIIDPFLKSSNILTHMFNNTEQFNRFRTKISVYDSLVSSHQESGNMELWNATIDGLRVLRSWGVKYWDPGYLFRNNVFSSECLRRVVGEGVCGVCGGGSEVLPCKSLCHNVVIGCIKSPLAQYIESPWKHAVNSVRTAIRLVITTGGDARQNTQPLQDLVSDLNDWREPLTWWIPEYKRTVACEGLPTANCWNGDKVGKYEFGPANWRSSFNPEFSNVHVVGDGGFVHPNVIVELDRFRNELVGVRKSLEQFWPTTQPQKHAYPHALALSSSESISPPHSSYIPDLEETGSGGHDYEGHDLEDDYGSGYGGNNPNLPDSDDEDLAGYSSGSGDKAPDLDNQVSRGSDGLGKVTDLFETEDPPVGISSCGGVKGGVVVVVLTLVLREVIM